MQKGAGSRGFSLLLSDRSDVMNFQEAIAYVTALGKLGFNFGLSRMEEKLYSEDVKIIENQVWSWFIACSLEII
jgi:hypothetical protein